MTDQTVTAQDVTAPHSAGADLAMPEGAGELTGVAAWVVEMMETMGAPGAGIAVAAENLFPPIPSEVILPLAGFTAARGDMSLAAALVWTTAGSVVGALLLYLLGRGFGRERMHAIVARLPLVQVGDLERSEAWFARYGAKAVLFGRMIPLVRSLVSVPAGVEAMPVGRFLALTAVGSATWNTVFVLAGYGLGEQWTVVESYASVLQKLVLATATVAVTVFVVRRVRDIRTRRRDARAHRPAPVDSLER